jgi:type I restriction enzyme S subunit
MARYKPYEKYKDSGVEWIGQIPEHWEVEPLFRYYKERKNKNIGGLEQNVLSLSYGRIKRRDLSDNFGLLPESFEGYNIVEPGNLVLRLTDLQNDHQSLRCGLVWEIGVITSAYVTLEPISSIDEDYGYWLMYAYDLLKVFYGFGAGVRQSMTFRDLKWMPLTLPPFREQHAIADFLDQRTSELDTLIADKEKLVTLLQEYRQAIISEAVTKGLNPDAKMKDSGVEWIGEIPEHWEVNRLKYVAEYQVSNVDKIPLDAEQTVRLCNYTDIYNNEFISPKLDLMITTATPIEIRKFGLAAGDVIITKDSEDWRDIAVPALVIESTQDMVCGYHLAMIRSQKLCLLGSYLFRLLQSRKINSQFQVEARGVTRYGIPKNAIGNAVIPIVPIEEQQAIADYLDQKTSETDDLISGIQGSIAQLKSYRQSLISEAVTGKFDVRGVI